MASPTCPSTPWAAERGAVVTSHVDGADDVTLPTVPWRLSGSTDQAPPRLGAFGADNDDVLAELLGLGGDQIDELYARARPAPRRAPPKPTPNPSSERSHRARQAGPARSESTRPRG